MFTLLISFLISILLSVSLLFLSNIYISMICFFISFIASYFVITKIITKQIKDDIIQIQLDLQNKKYNLAISKFIIIKKNKSSWQFYLKESIYGQIGIIYYIQKKYSDALPYLDLSLKKHWETKAMLAIIYKNNNDIQKMNDIFTLATKFSPKKTLLWLIWAYCLNQLGQKKKALDTLLLAQKKIGLTDKSLQSNTNNQSMNKKLDLHSFGDEWYQFHLEIPNYQKKKFTVKNK